MIDKEKVITAVESCFEYWIDKNEYKLSSVAIDHVRKLKEDALKLLKEQEPKTGHWIFESRYYDAWSNICSECGRLMTTAVGTYANFCSNCGAKMTGGDLSSEIPNILKI